MLEIAQYLLPKSKGRLNSQRDPIVAAEWRGTDYLAEGIRRRFLDLYPSANRPETEGGSMTWTSSQ